MFCTVCGAKIEEDSVFCTACGSPVASDDEAACSSCGAKLVEDDRFCTACGAPVITTAAAATPAATASSVATPAVIPAATVTSAFSTVPTAKRKGSALPFVAAGVAVVLVAAIAIFVADPFGWRGSEGSDSDADAGTSSVATSSSSSAVSSNSSTNTSSTPIIASVTASSNLPTDSVNTSTYKAANLIDGDLTLCWCENAAGSGVGESLSFTFKGEANVSGFRIANGFQISDDLYAANARVERMEVLIDGTSIGSFKISDSGRAWQTVNFGATYEASSVKLVIKEVYEGSRYEDCCISEIEFF